MSKERSNTVHRMWPEKSLANGGLKEVWNGHEKLVAKAEGNLLEYSRI